MRGSLCAEFLAAAYLAVRVGTQDLASGGHASHSDSKAGRCASSAASTAWVSCPSDGALRL